MRRKPGQPKTPRKAPRDSTTKPTPPINVISSRDEKVATSEETSRAALPTVLWNFLARRRCANTSRNQAPRSEGKTAREESERRKWKKENAKTHERKDNADAKNAKKKESAEDNAKEVDFSRLGYRVSQDTDKCRASAETRQSTDEMMKSRLGPRGEGPNSTIYPRAVGRSGRTHRQTKAECLAEEPT